MLKVEKNPKNGRFIKIIFPCIHKNMGGETVVKCKSCGSEMLRAPLDLGTIKGSGFRRIYAIAWICPNAVRPAQFPNCMVYCTSQQPRLKAESKPKDVVTVEL